MAPKRLRKRVAKDGALHSESENDLGTSPKRLRMHHDSTTQNSPFSMQLSSTLIDDSTVSSSDSEISLNSSEHQQNDSKYESFLGFLKSHSMVSGSEDEEPRGTEIKQPKSSTSNRRLSIKLSSSGVESGTYKNVSSEQPQQDIRVISVPFHLSEVVLLQHPASLTLRGYTKVSVLVGCISILGYEVKEGEKVEVLSTEATKFKKVSTLQSLRKMSEETLHKKLSKLTCYDPNCDLESFINQIGPTSVVIVLAKCTLPAPLQFLELYYPAALRPKWGRRITNLKAPMCSTATDNTIVISLEDEMVAEDVMNAICSSKNNGSTRILVYGPKWSGKSSLLRYLVNTVLNKYPTVYFLDCDPGQTEFTPPGVVSLTKVTEPLLGPSFTHQKKPVKMIFTGSITAQTSPPMYLKCVKNLVDFFTSKFPQEILFVNTMGWLQGMGGTILETLTDFVNPTVRVEFITSEGTPTSRDILPNSVISFKIPTRYPRESLVPHQYFKPADVRTYALVSYLGKCQKYYMEPTYLNAFQPYVVCWDNIAISVIGKKVPPSRLIESVHCSIVALCSVSESLMLESEKSEFPKTLCDEPINECLGFGIVRAADEVHHNLYIVTPTSIEDLQNVNAIIKGNIVVPEQFFLKQMVENAPLPYTDVQKAAAVSTRKIVKKRSGKTFRDQPT